MITAASIFLAVVTLQRGGELLLARLNTKRLLSQGAVETGAKHYPLMVLLHACWLAGLWLWGWAAPLIPWLVWVYALLQLFRLWILVTLGRRWTTRVITLPGETLVRHGPFRFLRHPNYLLVLLEIPLVPLALNMPWFAMAFGFLNVMMLGWRIHIENRALSYS